MPLLIIAGIPTSVMRRNKNYSPEVDDWDILLIPSRNSSRADLMSCWHDVMAKAAEDEQGSHVFAYHYREDEYPRFSKMMHDRYRLVWMDRGSLKDFGSISYTDMIGEYLDFERGWRDMLRPHGVDAPSLLPESSFLPRTKRCSEMWSRIRSVQLCRDNLERVFKLVRHFRDSHYKRGLWEDSRGLQFKAASALHGSNPPYGSIKFTFHMPSGFHYDVRDARPNRRFSICDAEGRSYQFDSYTNIDCHGSVRGGT